MTQDERNLLTDLANKIAQTPPPPKDSEAEEFIRTHIGSRPDALYLMTQTVLIQNLALQHAQQQIQELQQRAGQPAAAGAGGSFLGQSPASSRNPGYGAGSQQYSAPPPQYAAPASSIPNPGGAPSFLKGAAQTAAGVAAGALAFEGIQSLFSHPGYGGGAGFGGFGGGGLGGGNETVVNNYYDNDNPADDRNAYSNDDGQQFDDSSNDASYDTASDDGGGFDDGGGDNFV